jgi:hypothetical protein
MPRDPDDYGFYQAAAAAKAAPVKVTVEKGDTLSSIAKENNTTLKAILDANPKFTQDPKYKNGNLIFPDTKVVIPPKPSTASTTDSASRIGITYTDDIANYNWHEGFNKQETVDSGNLGGGSSGGGISGGETPPPPLVDPVPNVPLIDVPEPPAPPVKTAPIDTVLFNNDELPIEVMTDLIFEDIGGHELINIARNDIVNGQEVSYQPIKNLSSIQQQYNPNNIVSLQDTADKYFAGFPIKLENKIPNPGTGPNGSYVYLDPFTGNLVIEAVNLENDEQIEIEVSLSGTIYEAEFGEIIS